MQLVGIMCSRSICYLEVQESRLLHARIVLKQHRLLNSIYDRVGPRQELLLSLFASLHEQQHTVNVGQNTTTSNHDLVWSGFTCWAARYNTWLLIESTPKGAVFSFLFRLYT